MTGRPLVSMVMIARDEEANIEPCFQSFWDYVDEVVLLDTGSTDGTVKRAKAFARARGETRKLIVGEYEWHDDFAAARNHADSLASGEWIAWCDLDDEIVGAEHLTELAQTAPESTVGFVFDYEYARDPNGNTICTLKRERLVRAGSGTWLGRVHEAQAFPAGEMTMIPASRAFWRHRKAPAQPTARNLRILEKWAEDEPTNGRVLQYLGTERAGQGKHDEAVEAYERFLVLDGEPPEYRAQCWRKLAASLIALERVQDAHSTAVRALGEFPAWPDAYLTLAQTCHVLGKHDQAIEWAQHVLRKGIPDTLLIINPLDYTVEPRVVLAGSLAALGRLDEAVQIAEEVFTVVPEHPLLGPAYAGWLGARKRKSTAATWVSCARMLCAHDEQQKALDLLERTVPFYVQDDPEIVAMRSQLRERLAFATDPALYAEHYVSGGSKPEDMIADDNVTSLCEALPRTQFLARSIRELKEAA